jgi:hypothetical protein
MFAPSTRTTPRTHTCKLSILLHITNQKVYRYEDKRCRPPFACKMTYLIHFEGRSTVKVYLIFSRPTVQILLNVLPLGRPAVHNLVHIQPQVGPKVTIYINSESQTFLNQRNQKTWEPACKLTLRNGPQCFTSYDICYIKDIRFQ